MSNLPVKRTLWDFWAPRYHRLWVQRVSLGPTRALIHSRIQQVAPEARRFLDLGCGIGQLARELAERHPDAEILAVDPSSGMIERAEREFGHPKLTYRVGGIEAVADDQRFDVITSTHSFPYVPDAEAAMARMAELVAPGGRVLVVHANTENLWDWLVLKFVELTTTPAVYRSAKQVHAVMEKAGLSPGIVQPIDKAFYMPSIQLVEGLA